MSYGPLSLNYDMGRIEPRVDCEVFFFKPLPASTTLSALDAVHADSSIGAVVRELPGTEELRA